MTPEACRRARTTVVLQGKGERFEELKAGLLAAQADAGGEDFVRLRIRETGKPAAGVL